MYMNYKVHPAGLVFLIPEILLFGVIYAVYWLFPLALGSIVF